MKGSVYHLEKGKNQDKYARVTGLQLGPFYAHIEKQWRGRLMRDS
jgi:hypothetical protein